MGRLSNTTFSATELDPVGLARAALANLSSGGRGQGASTITMQVARNFFLSREKTYNRKLYEILLSLKIEQNLSKDQILELYINQIFLGQRAYGFAAAARAYYGKTLEQLSLPESAMLAGLPKAPSAFNPIVNPARAAVRQQYVLRRMLEAGFIDNVQFEEALTFATPRQSQRDTAAARKVQDIRAGHRDGDVVVPVHRQNRRAPEAITHQHLCRRPVTSAGVAGPRDLSRGSVHRDEVLGGDHLLERRHDVACSVADHLRQDADLRRDRIVVGSCILGGGAQRLGIGPVHRAR